MIILYVITIFERVETNSIIDIWYKQSSLIDEKNRFCEKIKEIYIYIMKKHYEKIL